MSGLADPTEHDELLNYRLKRLVKLGGAPAIRLCEGRYGVTRRQWRMLAALVERGPLSPSMLAEVVQQERAIVSRLVTELVSKELVQRSEHAGDRRRAELVATSAGHRLYNELFPLLAQINRRLMMALNASEAAMLDRVLDKLTARARQIHAEGDGDDARADRRHGGSRRSLPKAPGNPT
jgi:DNA-binding MarR family transcriptional regulator